jgi:hypothetical protein
MPIASGVALLLALSLTPVGVLADSYEPDDSSASARRFFINSPAQKHDFGKVRDQDWIVFFAASHTSYSIAATEVAPNCDVSITLFGADGRTTVTPPGLIDDGGPGEEERVTLARHLPTGFYYARFRSENPSVYGATVTYSITVNEITGAGLPIETVDERTIGIRKSPAGSPRPAAMAVLTPWDRGNRPPYHRHRIEFPGYEETTTGTSVDVRISWATEAEKYDLTGQRFPSRSWALFAVTATQWSGGNSTPKAFTDPVNLTVEFSPNTPSPYWNDIVTFQDTDGVADKMRIVRDTVDGPGVNFQFISGTQQVDLVQRTVTIRNYRNLTGASGRATYGAVVNPNATTEAARWPLYR